VHSVDQSRSADTERNGTVKGRTILRKPSVRILSGIRHAITRSAPSGGGCGREVKIEGPLKNPIEEGSMAVISEIGRGRDISYLIPPARIPTSGTAA